jgi:glycogen operon protein
VHDGFTLADLVSYAHKHNEANGEDNKDGSDQSDSANFGVEGPTDDLKINRKRMKLRRCMIASLMLAQGVPLILAGDEVANSQGGNNNAYCQDGPIGWVDWSGLGDINRDMTVLIGLLAALRRQFPQLAAQRWHDNAPPGSIHAIQWWRPDGLEMTEGDWHFKQAHFIAWTVSPNEEGGPPVLVALNCSDNSIEVQLPQWPGYSGWRRVFTTTENIDLPAEAPIASGESFEAAYRSVSVFGGYT